MLSTIFTWIGAVLGMAVLLAMAFGAFVMDLGDARGPRPRRDPDRTEVEENSAGRTRGG